MPCGLRGNHRQQALLVARGPGFPRGDSDPIRTQDVAPTLLDFLGIPIPDHYEGRSVGSSLAKG